MSVVGRAELIDRIRNYLGESPTDEGIAILEDLNDSWVTDVNIRSEMQARIDEVDARWRKKYADRFMGKNVQDESIVTKEYNDDDDDNLMKTYEELIEYETKKEE